MFTISVQDEFSTLRAAIVHDASNAADVTMDDWRSFLPPEALARHPEAGPSSKERLVEQHRRLRALLTENGVELLSPEPQNEAYGQMFTRDPCFAIGETLFIAGLCDEWRLIETAGLREIRTRFERVIDLSGGSSIIEGGDVMILDAGRQVLVGRNEHTDDGGFRKLSHALSGSGIDVVCVPHDALHLDCCLAPLPNGEALYAAQKLPDASVSKLAAYFERLTALDVDESNRYLAANLLWLDHRRVVSGVVTTKTNALLRERAYEVIELDFSDLVSQCGSFRCAVCPIERGPANADPIASPWSPVTSAPSTYPSRGSTLRGPKGRR